MPPPTIKVYPSHGGLTLTLTPNDVLSGRGVNVILQNTNFRLLAAGYIEEYFDDTTKKSEKMHIACRLVDEVRRLHPPGRFLKQVRENDKNIGIFVEIGDKKAWLKAGQTMREINNVDVGEVNNDTTSNNQRQPPSFNGFTNSSGTTAAQQQNLQTIQSSTIMQLRTPKIHPHQGGIILERFLTPHDVISGRGDKIRAHNINFTNLVEKYKEVYFQTRNPGKMHIIADIVDTIRIGGGRFLKEEIIGGREHTGRYVEIGDEKAWIKISNTLHKRNDDGDANGDAANIHNSNQKQTATKSNDKRKSDESASLSNRKSKVNSRSSINSSSTTSSSQNTSNDGRTPQTGSIISVSSQQQGQKQAGRLVIIRPSSTTSALLDESNNTDLDGHQQWPLYNRHCQTYGFGVAVEQHVVVCQDRSASENANSRGGPSTNLVLVANEDNAKSASLKCISERLTIRFHHSSKNANSGKRSTSKSSTKRDRGKLHLELNDGDIIQTLDGISQPTFGMLYAMMCKNEKIVLEVMDGSASFPLALNL